MTDDLVSWLRAQLDDDEQAIAEVKSVGLDTLIPGAMIDRTGATYFFTSATYKAVRSTLDPDRLLAEVQAKRAILAEHEPRTQTTTHLLNDPREYSRTWYACPTCNPTQNPHDEAYDWQLEEGCPTVRLLAAVFSDRPGYQEWKP